MTYHSSPKQHLFGEEGKQGSKKTNHFSGLLFKWSCCSSMLTGHFDSCFFLHSLEHTAILAWGKRRGLCLKLFKEGNYNFTVKWFSLWVQEICRLVICCRWIPSCLIFALVEILSGHYCFLIEKTFVQLPPIIFSTWIVFLKNYILMGSQSLIANWKEGPLFTQSKVRGLWFREPILLQKIQLKIK